VGDSTPAADRAGREKLLPDGRIGRAGRMRRARMMTRRWCSGSWPGASSDGS